MNYALFLVLKGFFFLYSSLYYKEKVDFLHVFKNMSSRSLPTSPTDLSVAACKQVCS